MLVEGVSQFLPYGCVLRLELHAAKPHILVPDAWATKNTTSTVFSVSLTCWLCQAQACKETSS